MKTFSTMEEVTEYVRCALGTMFAGDYDVDAIAEEICEWKDGRLTLCFGDDSEMFWNIAAAHDMSKEA